MLLIIKPSKNNLVKSSDRGRRKNIVAMVGGGFTIPFAIRFTVDEDHLPFQVGDPVISDPRLGRRPEISYRTL